MHPVQGGWTSHKIKGDGDYEAQKRAALAQSGKNSYIQGVQSVMDEGAGTAVTRTNKYGNVNIMPNEVLQGSSSNFAQKDAPGNQDLNDIKNRSGSIITEASSTNVPQEDPDSMETSALERRLSMMARGGQGFPGLNNRNREV